MFSCPICQYDNVSGLIQCHNCCFPIFKAVCEDGFYSLFPQFNFAANENENENENEDEERLNSGISRCPVIVVDPPRTCPICLSDDMYVGIRMEGCGHMFHEKCIETWLEREDTCPVCRGQIK